MKNQPKKHRFLKLIRKTRLAMSAQVKCVIGWDEDGAFSVVKCK